MKKLIYTGPLKGGGTVVAQGKEFPFQEGVPVDIPESVSAELIASGDWQEAEE